MNLTSSFLLMKVQSIVVQLIEVGRGLFVGQKPQEKPFSVEGRGK